MASNRTTAEIHSDISKKDPQSQVFAPDIGIAALTYVTFFLLLFILHKYAWKPILGALDRREETIRKGIEDAKKSSEELSQIEKKRYEIIEEAHQTAWETIAKGRKAAQEAAKIIEHKTKEETQVMLANAAHEINVQTQKAHMELRKEGVEVAVNLAHKIIEETLTEDKQRKLIDKYIKEFKPEKYE